jgi:hypothetical protein
MHYIREVGIIIIVPVFKIGIWYRGGAEKGCPPIAQWIPSVVSCRWLCRSQGCVRPYVSYLSCV